MRNPLEVNSPHTLQDLSVDEVVPLLPGGQSMEPDHVIGYQIRPDPIQDNRPGKAARCHHRLDRSPAVVEHLYEEAEPGYDEDLSGSHQATCPVPQIQITGQV
jgi:hypothetical protein